MTKIANYTDEVSSGGSGLNDRLGQRIDQNAALMPCGTAVTNCYDAYAAGIKAEREACAKLAEVCDDAESAARFIRGRSNVK